MLWHGFGIYELPENKQLTDLDECRGHSDVTRSYHVNKPGSNQILSCLHGQTAPEERRPRY